MKLNEILVVANSAKGNAGLVASKQAG